MSSFRDSGILTTIQFVCVLVMDTTVDTVDYVEGARGHRVVIHDGYIFHKSKTLKSGVKWTCSCRKSATCTVFIILQDDIVVKTEHAHSHPPTPGHIKARQLKASMRKRAREESTPMQVIYEQEKVRLLSESSSTNSVTETAAALPQFAGIKTVLYRERRKRFPTMPTSRAEVQLEGTWTTTVMGDRFLLGEDGEGDNKIIAFASDRGLKELSNAETYYVDGTFDTAPRLFYQLITIHAFVLGVMLPLVFGLLPNKEQRTYVRFMTMVKDKAAALGYHLKPVRIMQDFELGLMNANLLVFPEVAMKGCFFHYAQCLWRKIQNLGLAVDYKDSDVVRAWFRKVLALPFVPEQQVAEAFASICRSAPDVSRVSEFICYYNSTWISGQYPMRVWNFFRYCGPRTNNHVEGYHSRLIKKAGKSHPNIFEVVALFVQEEASGLVQIIQLESGQPAPKRRRMYVDTDSRISDLGLQYMTTERSLDSYLDALGHLMGRALITS